MDFPKYVPPAVKAHLSRELYGGDIFDGWIAWLDKASKELADVDEWIRVRTLRGEVDVLDSLRLDRAAIIERRNSYARDVACLQRFATDLRMREGYKILAQELPQDEHQRGFMSAAWSAVIDYIPYRERIKRAESLKDEIADIAHKLAKAIREYSKLGMYGPDEFYSIPHLLRETDNHEMQGHNLHMWKSMRVHILGDIPEYEKSNRNCNLISPTEINRTFVKSGDQVEVDPKQQARDLLRYAWGTAPCFDELLDTVERGARSYKPKDMGMIQAAISKRQHSEKAEYIRAFAHSLDDVHHIALTTALMRAMAIIGTVALDSPDTELTFDDIRKTLINSTNPDLI